MGVSKIQAAENRKAIIAASERLFREHGFDGVGLSALMKAAGFTQGGFYNHFASKDALAAAVVTTAIDSAYEDLKQSIAAPLRSGDSRLKRQVNHYLSGEHCADIEQGCPIAGFTGDVRRLGDEAQAHFAAGLDGMFETLAGLVAEEMPARAQPAEARSDAIEVYTAMAGALLLARAVADTRPDLAKEILETNRKALIGKLTPELAPDAR